MGETSTWNIHDNGYHWIMVTFLKFNNDNQPKQNFISNIKEHIR